MRFFASTPANADHTAPLSHHAPIQPAPVLAQLLGLAASSTGSSTFFLKLSNDSSPARSRGSIMSRAFPRQVRRPCSPQGAPAWAPPSPVSLERALERRRRATGLPPARRLLTRPREVARRVREARGGRPATAARPGAALRQSDAGLGGGLRLGAARQRVRPAKLGAGAVNGEHPVDPGFNRSEPLRRGTRTAPQ